ncbi:MAG: protein TolQ [Hyphomicrobiales bacterium]|jgi:biopolymer transport protein TolQ|nr:protein TolQ [Hyphomicrobiales bacterium]|tara:strand:- start:5101 stop:5856 length:756 start_codon:yes stop_codon:yes gene_type:complete
MDESILLNEKLYETDLSLMGLFIEADIVVKIVMLGLMVASIISWAIIIEKLVVIKTVNRNAIKFYRDFWSSNINDIDATYRNPRNNPMAKIFNAGIKEWNTTFKINKNMSIEGVKGRIEKTMNVQMNIELDKLEKKLLFLASVGSTAPFIGLFGTVYGIMNSFSAIAASKSTNLTVVAPGIAEALFATAIGLFAAIPAVMFYNKISSDISRVTSNLENFSDEFINYFSRQIDAQMVEGDMEDQFDENDNNF